MEASCATGGATGATVAAALKFFAAAQCLLTETWPPQAQIQDLSSFDYIVVGGGTAGSVLAARLSELPYSVLLLEAGDDPPQDTNVPAFKDLFKGPPLDWNFKTTNDSQSSQALYRGVQAQPSAKVLGGCGSINDMIYSRGFPVDYEEWASIVGEDWSWNNVLDYFKKTEQLTDPRILRHRDLAELHGMDGEIEVTGSDVTPLYSEKFIEGFRELGFQLISDMTKPSAMGVGRYSHTIRNGKRDSSLTALLNKAATRDNLFVLKNALVTKILIENNTAHGVRVLMENDTELQFFANKEIVITAGTFNTPKLLLLSGIGPREQLTKLEIPLVKDLPVGENLHDHSMVLTYFAAESGTCTIDEKNMYMETIRYLYDRSGFLSRTSDMGVYVSFNNSKVNAPDFAIFPSCMPLNTPFYDGCRNVLNFSPHICSQIEDINKKYEVFTVAVVNLKPNSRGRVELKSADPLEPPLIYSGTFSDINDLTHYPEVIRTALSVIRSSYFRSKNAFTLDFSLKNCKSTSGNERVKCFTKNMALPAWHSVGTAAMGSVLDSKLRVLGIDGLRVADASVMPKVTRGNTNAPVVMIAEKAADFIKETYTNLYETKGPDAKPTFFTKKNPKPTQNIRPTVNDNYPNRYPTTPTYNKPNLNNYPDEDTITFNEHYSSANNLNGPSSNPSYNPTPYPNNYYTNPNQYNNYPNRYPSTSNPNGLKGWAAVATTAIETVGSIVDTFIKTKIPNLGYMTGNPKDAGNLTMTTEIYRDVEGETTETS